MCTVFVYYVTYMYMLSLLVKVSWIICNMILYVFFIHKELPLWMQDVSINSQVHFHIQPTIHSIPNKPTTKFI